VNPALGAWAQRFHATCEALSVFGRLAAECRGDPAAAAAATETILRLLDLPKPDAPSPAASPNSSADPLRRPLAAACAAASRAVDELREAIEGLASGAFGNVPGTAAVPRSRHRTGLSFGRSPRDSGAITACSGSRSLPAASSASPRRNAASA
jgi:hypothetical protein